MPTGSDNPPVTNLAGWTRVHSFKEFLELMDEFDLVNKVTEVTNKKENPMTDGFTITEEKTQTGYIDHQTGKFVPTEAMPEPTFVQTGEDAQSA